MILASTDRSGVTDSMARWETRRTTESTRRILWEREGWSRRAPSAGEAAEEVSAPAGAYAPATVPVPRTLPGAPVHAIIDARAVEIVFQPVLDAARRHVVGFEALARGPEGELRAPRRLFAAARAVGRAGELDWICRAAAFRRFMDAGMHPSVSLFVNVEPDSLIAPCPEDVLPVIWEAEARLRVFIDIAGQGLLRHPLEVLESLGRARAAGWGVVLNDLEFSAAAVSLLPVLEPDVIRLDQRTIRQGSDRVTAALAAALTEAERVGTALLVDSVEEQPGSLARSVAAGYIQGRLLGAEGALPPAVPPLLAPIPLRTPETTGATPWEVVAASSALATTDVSDESLDRLVRQFVGRASSAPELPAVGVVTSVYRATRAETARQYRLALENAPLSILVGRDMATYRDWRTRGVEPAPADPLAAEFCFVALSAGHASVLTARPSAVRDGRATAWDIGMSHDPLICRRVMRELLRHVDRIDGSLLGGTAAV
jgi:EAL domain-containing protein (putative c-di-GMP-specific phosphodiesterase class I)